MRSEPIGLAVLSKDRAQDRLFIANFGSSSLVILDKKGQKGWDMQILQGEYGPTQIVMDEDRDCFYVTNQRDNSVSSFSLSMRTAVQGNRYRVGLRPTGLALDSERNYLYVVNSGEGSLSVIDLRQERVVESIKVGREPFGVDLIRK